MRVCFVFCIEAPTGERGDSDDVIVTGLCSVVVLFEIWVVFFYRQSERVMWFCLVWDVGRSLDLYYWYWTTWDRTEPQSPDESSLCLLHEASFWQTCCYWVQMNLAPPRHSCVNFGRFGHKVTRETQRIVYECLSVCWFCVQSLVVLIQCWCTEAVKRPAKKRKCGVWK